MKNCNCCTTYNAPDLMDGGVTAARIEEEATEQPRTLTPDAITDEMVERGKLAFYQTAEGDLSLDVRVRRSLTVALTEPPQRPDWLDAPAVRAWHKNDRRTEHDGTPGEPRIWSPDYGTTEVWSTPSLPHMPWSDLVDVEPLSAPEGDPR